MKRITLTLPAPYVGLRPFAESESLLFFGRERHVRDLLASLDRQQRFTAVLGASGTGKSSLVRAGLIPALHRGALHPPGGSEAMPPQHWNVCIFQPGDSPLANLSHALTDDARWTDSADRATAVSSLAAALGASSLALADLYRQKAGRFAGESLLLVVDQFEEIFRYRQKNPDEADSFITLLLRSAGEALPIYVVMTMRSDFLGHCVAFHGLPEAINSGIYLTPRLSPEQIRSVIVSPLALVGGSINAVLANRMINALGGDDELPILEHALLRMWQRARSMGRSEVGVDDFETICAPRRVDQGPGTTQHAPMLSYAIDNHAGEIYGALTNEQQCIARQLFLALVERREGRELRRPQTMRELLPLIPEDGHSALRTVIDAFRADDAGFVLPRAGRPINDDDLIDISHESLFRQWQLFRQWLTEEGHDVAELREWRQRAARRQSEGGGWLDENDCQRAQRWRLRVIERTHPPAWAQRYEGAAAYALIDEYVQTSIDRVREDKAHDEALQRQAGQERTARLEAEALLQREATQRAEAEKQQAVAFNKVLRRRSRVAIVVGSIAVALALVAVVLGVQANKAQKQAEALARRALASELSAIAEGLGREHPDESVLLALAARTIAAAAKADTIVRAASDTYPYSRILRGHADAVSVVQFSADGRTALTASDDSTARLWDLLSGRELHILRGHEGQVSSAHFSADGKAALTAGDDSTARLWDVSSGRELHVLRGHEGPLWSARFSPDGQTVLTASDDHTARLWEVASGRELRVLRGHRGPVRDAQFSADGRTMLTASDDTTARLWDVSSGRELRVFRGHQGSLWSATLSADGKMAVTASYDQTARLWDVVSGRARQVLRGHEDSVRSAEFSADGKTVLTASRDKTARLWDALSGRELHVLRGHEGPVWSGRFSGDGKTVLTASRDRTARLWDVASGRELRVLRGHEGAVWRAQFSADGKNVLTAGSDRTARLWEVQRDHELRVLRGHQGEVWSAQFSADGKTVLTASSDLTARLWDVASGRQRGVLSGHQGPVRTAQFSADGKTIITASEDNTARLWDVASGRELRILSGHQGPVLGAQLSPDGKTALTAGSDQTARLWDVASGGELHTFRGHQGPVLSARFSADGKTVLTASQDKTVRLWNVASGRQLLVLDGFEEPVVSAQFSPDGTTVLTASEDHTARLWDVASGRELPVLHGHEGAVRSADFSPDGKTALTAGDDQTARLWDVVTGHELRVLRGHTGPVRSAQFSADGKTLVTASDDRTVRFWRCDECRPIDEIAAEVAARVGRDLTEQERRRLGVPDSLSFKARMTVSHHLASP
ncbi:WD-40 repeat protein [Candidatus Accumulibacter aalborgensis]|uniref:WD-40 repeat protein n=1 Tax=Candidatus Accumulibacter aalborgensis TaxID=1860102 RepID=A0A1A8XKX1_9PROT|nr:WD40 repeat domain-containing protein [Candidatus Accumulibacter aalborgensis]SBT05819.1 WD-40 repeat protein [Candidatus Accumulibacter aalborgensis]